MKKLLLIAAFLTGCVYRVSPIPNQRPSSDPTPLDEDASRAKDLDSMTVAVFANGLCSGVWIDVDRVLSARHCVVVEDGDLVPGPYSVVTNDGQKYGAKVLAYGVEENEDLSLITVPNPPAHAIARIAAHKPPVGDKLHFVGHPNGLAWSHCDGIVAADRGDFMQVAAQIWFGNSGGGAFLDDEELTGISSFLYTDLPTYGFYVSVDQIHAFLAKHP